MPHTKRTERTALVQIAATGVRYFGLTLASAEEPGSPPSREKAKIIRDAEVTVLLSVKQKVVRSFAFRAGELNEAKIAEVLKGVDEIAPAEAK